MKIYLVIIMKGTSIKSLHNLNNSEQIDGLDLNKFNIMVGILVKPFYTFIARDIFMEM